MSDQTVDGQGRDFFISYTTVDRAWAEWIAVALEQAGYTTYIQSFDFRPGSDFAHLMHKAATTTERTIAVLSPAYLNSEFGEAEWRIAFANDPSGDKGLLIPVRVDECQPPGILTTRVYADLVNVNEEGARKKLLAAVDRQRPRPSTAAFPGTTNGSELHTSQSAVPFPRNSSPATASAKAITNLPRRNLGFVGRSTALARLADALQRSGRVVTRSRDRLAGVGKTQLAIEYAHRTADQYEVTWLIPAENVDLISGHLTQLAVRTGIARADVTGPVAAQAVADALDEGRRWLLIFDNAEDPDQLATLLPPDGGHIIITSRNPGNGETALPVEVGLFDRTESVHLLHDRVPGLASGDADRIADALGDLPLALAQAAPMLARGLSPAEFLDLLHQHAGMVLDRSGPDSYPTPLASTVRAAADRLVDDDLAAGGLLNLCALLGPEPIPAWLFTQTTAPLPEPLQDLIADRLAFYDTLDKLAASGLAASGPDGILMHRLVHAILRDQMDTVTTESTRFLLAGLVATATPVDTDDPALWPQWAAIAPHILALDPATTDDPDLRDAAGRLAFHLLRRGDYPAGIKTVKSLYDSWRDRLGPDDLHTLKAATEYAHALHVQGHYRQANTLTADTLDRYRRVVGDDHPDTLRSASDFATTLHTLGDYTGAHTIREGVLTRRRTILGPDHPDTLSAAAQLASTLHAQGDYTGAHTIREGVLTRRRTILGPDHPDTLSAAGNLATTLHAQGDYTGAHTIEEDVLTRRRTILGPDHPDTITAAGNLAGTLHAQGDYTGAHTIEEDVLTRRRTILGPDHPDTLTAAGNLATTLHAQGDYTGARTIEEDVLTRSRTILGPDHPDTITAAANLAATLHRLGQTTEATSLTKDAYERSEQNLGKDHPTTLRRACEYARCLLSKGQLFQARSLVDDTLRRQRRLLGLAHPITRDTHELRKKILLLMGGTSGSRPNKRPRR